MGYLLDTNVFIDIEDGILNPENLPENDDDGYYTSAIVYSEFYKFYLESTDPLLMAIRLSSCEYLSNNYNIIPFDKLVAETYAELCTKLNRTERNAHDYMIAATAIYYDLTVVTKDSDLLTDKFSNLKSIDSSNL